jgi:glycosyltransferase involved in cell wall biosynthesis
VNGDDLAEFRLTSRKRYLLARATRGLLLRHAAGLVFVTHELAAKPSFAGFHRPSSVVANGIDLSSIEPAPPRQNETPRLIFIGHPSSPWHGLDEVQAIADANPTWRFDIVGPGPEELAATTPNLEVHGLLAPSQYQALLAAADVAVGSLALYRAGIDEASTLKVREYLAAGLPVVIGYHDTDFPKGAPFILQVPNVPAGVRSAMEALRAFVESWLGRRVPRSEVGHLDVRVKEATRLRFIEAVGSG